MKTLIQTYLIYYSIPIQLKVASQKKCVMAAPVSQISHGKISFRPK